MPLRTRSRDYLSGVHPFIRVGDELELIQPHASQADWLLRVFQTHRADFRPRFPWIDQFQTDVRVRAFLYDAERYNQGGQRLTLFVRHRDELVGSLAFVRMDSANRTAEIGFWLVQNARGRGLMTDCCRTLLRHGFGPLQLHRVFLQTQTDNAVVFRLANRLGFRHEGTLREAALVNGAYTDLAVFGLLKSEFLAPAAT